MLLERACAISLTGLRSFVYSVSAWVAHTSEPTIWTEALPFLRRIARSLHKRSSFSLKLTAIKSFKKTSLIFPGGAP